MSAYSKKANLDEKPISLSAPHEVRCWAEAFGISETQFRAAVVAVGHSAEKVREYLRQK